MEIVTSTEAVKSRYVATIPTLFLDIDGVLHPLGVADVDAKGQVFGDRLFRWLPKLLEALQQFPKVQVVLHSSWRLLWQYEDALRKQLPAELSEKIVDFTDINISNRWDSIKEYCVRKSIVNYVILDDDSEAFPFHCPELVRCMSSQGLSRQSTYNNLLLKLKELPHG